MAEGETDQGERIAVDATLGRSGERWRKYWMNLASAPFARFRPRYAAWVLLRWNEAHPGRRVRSLEIVLRRESRRPDGAVDTTFEVLASSPPAGGQHPAAAASPTVSLH